MSEHSYERRDNERVFFECGPDGRGTLITAACADDMRFCPFCGEQLVEAIPAYLRDSA